MLLTDISEICNTKTIVRVKCDYCGDIIEKTYLPYTKGRKNIAKDSCSKCVGLKCADATRARRQHDFYDRLTKACQEVGYTLASQEEDIDNNSTYIKYICPEHGEQSMKIGNFLTGKRCPGCQRDNARNRWKKNSKLVADDIASCCGELLNPEDYRNNREQNLIVLCPSCGKPFTTSYVLFTQHGGQVCQSCRSSESIGEMRIRKYLDNKGLRYKQEYWVSDCRDKNPLPFDFFLPDMNRVIEFDGRQHFTDTNLFSYSLAKTVEHDRIKDQYCKNNGIEITRIPYTKINHISEILDGIFT